MFPYSYFISLLSTAEKCFAFVHLIGISLQHKLQMISWIFKNPTANKPRKKNYHSKDQLHNLDLTTYLHPGKQSGAAKNERLPPI